MSQPVYVASAEEEEEVARAIYESLPLNSSVREFHVYQGGVHGASTLRDDENAVSGERYRLSVREFLGRIQPGAARE